MSNIDIVDGPCVAKICLHACAKCIDSDSSQACAKFHPDICSILIQSIVFNDSVSEYRRT